jgi:hypothetical protein
MEVRETSDICQQFEVTDIGSRSATSWDSPTHPGSPLPTSLKMGFAAT